MDQESLHDGAPDAPDPGFTILLHGAGTRLQGWRWGWRWPVMRRGRKRATQRCFVFGAAGNSLSLWAQRARVIGP
jgi:hypothetical protein